MFILKRVVPLFLTRHLQIEFQFEYTSELYGIVDVATSFESAQANFEKPHLFECYLDKPHLYPAHSENKQYWSYREVKSWFYAVYPELISF